MQCNDETLWYTIKEIQAFLVVNECIFLILQNYWQYGCMYVSVLAHTDPKLAGGITWGKIYITWIIFKVYPKKSVLEKKGQNGDQVLKDTLFCAYFFSFSFFCCMEFKFEKKKLEVANLGGFVQQQ